MYSNVDYSDTYAATIQRQAETDPWGVRIRGGSDCNEPITVHQVRRKSPASKAGVKEGDLVSTIEDIPTDGMTHQQIADILASSRLTLKLTLIRQAPTHIHADEDGSVEHHRPRLNASSLSSKRTFQPVNQQQTAATVESKRQAVYNLAHRVQVPPPVKSYQPFDMLGASSSIHTSAPQRKVYQVSTTPVQEPSWQPTPTFLASMQAESENYVSFAPPPPPPPVVVNVNTSYEKPQSYWPVDPPSRPRSRNRQDDDADVIDIGSYGPPKQSKSFTLIETALAVQGAGETGLPPPRSATRENERYLESRRQLYAEWL